VAGLTVLDASVLIAYFDPEDAHGDEAVALLEEAEDLTASTITLAEILVGAARSDRITQRLAALADIGVKEIAIRQGDGAALAQIRADTGLRMPDCCVLHAAHVSGADSIATFDKPLKRAAAERGL
jgi:predicted nucleic acid-binding protein